MSMTSLSIDLNMIYNMAGICPLSTLFSNPIRKQLVTLMPQYHYVKVKHIFLGWLVLCWGPALTRAHVLKCESQQKAKFWPPSNLHSSGPGTLSFIYTLIEFFIPGLHEKLFIESYFDFQEIDTILKSTL